MYTDGVEFVRGCEPVYIRSNALPIIKKKNNERNEKGTTKRAGPTGYRESGGLPLDTRGMSDDVK